MRPVATEEASLLRGTVDISSCMEQLQNAYFLAVVAASRCTYAKPNPDNGIDWTVTHEAHHERYDEVKLDVQLKSTYQASTLRLDHLSYRLERDHYDKLRKTRVFVDRILVLLYMPEGIEEWLHSSEDRLALHIVAIGSTLEAIPRLISAR
jgi:hypothetical protein